MYFKIYKDMYLMYIIKALNKNCSELMYILSHNQVLLFTEFNNKAKKKKWHFDTKVQNYVLHHHERSLMKSWGVYLFFYSFLTWKKSTNYISYLSSPKKLLEFS